MDLNSDCLVIEFTNATGGALGKLTFMKDKLEFEGAADECAKQFVAHVRKHWLDEMRVCGFCGESHITQDHKNA